MNGDEVLIRNFFVQDDQGNRSDLVLQDAAGVDWWGQYTSPWQSFHFTEIDTDLFGAVPWLPAALGLLGLAAAGAAAGGGGGGGGGGGDGGGSATAPVAPPAPTVTLDPIALITDPQPGDTVVLTGTITVPPGTGQERVKVNVGGTDYDAVVKPDGTWSVTVPADGLANGTPVNVVGTVTGSGGESAPSTPAVGAIPVEYTPDASAPPVATDEDQPVDGQVTATDKDGDPLTYTVEDADKPSHGQVVIDPATGQYTYTPDPDFNGTDRFTVTVDDGRGGIVTVEVEVTVRPVNDAPRLAADEDEVKESGVVDGGNTAEPGTVQANGNVLVNDTDVEGDALAVTRIQHGANTKTVDPAGAVIEGTYGRLTIDADGKYTYELDNSRAPTQALASGQDGTEVFTYTVSDGAADAVQTLTITVRGTNDAPVITGGPAAQVLPEADAGLTATGTLTVSDVDLDDDVTASVTQVVAGGDGAAGAPDNAALLAMLGVTAGNVLSGATRTADLDWSFGSGAQAFDYLKAGQTLTLTYTVQVQDGKGATDTETVTITITGSNDAPVFGGATTGAVTEDADNPQLTTSGTLTIADADTGEAAFVAGPGTPVGATLGNLAITAGGAWTYQVDNALVQYLAQGQTRDEVFTVRSADGTEQTITVTITGTNDVPAVGGVVAGAVLEAGFDALGNPVGAATAGGQLTVADADVSDTHVWTLDGMPDTSYGTFTVDATGKWTYALDDTKPATQELNAGDTVTLTYVVRATDPQGASDTETVTITITGSNDKALISGAATGAVVEAGDLNNSTLNRPDAEGALRIDDVDDGEAKFQAPASLNGTYGTFTFDPATGEWSYRLDNDRPVTQALIQHQQVTDTLTVTSLDGTATQDIVVTITGSNDTPVVTDATGSVAEDTGVDAGKLTVDHATGSGVLTIVDVDTNESRFDPASVAFAGNTLSSVAPLGTLAVNDDGTWNYEVSNSRPEIQALGTGETIIERFTVKSADGTATSTVTITITGTNDAPVNTVPDTATTPLDAAEDAPLAIAGVSVSDVDGQVLTTTLTVAGGTAAVTAGGGAAIDGNGTSTIILTGTAAQINAALAGLTFVGTPDYHGPAQIGISTTDGTATDADTIAITVAAVADAADDSVTTPEDTPVTIAVLVNDSFEGAHPTITHIQGGAVTVGVPVAVANGTVTLTADGKLVFTPAADWNGDTSFTYTAKTDTGIEETATVNVTVTPVNDAPVPVGTIGDQANADSDTVAGVDVSGHFSDVDLGGGALGYSATGLPAGLSIDPVTGVISGTLAHDASRGGAHAVTVTATDPQGATVTQTFTWTVSNPAPDAKDDTVTVAEDTVLTGNVLTGAAGGHVPDVDPDGDPLVVVHYTVAGQTYLAGATAVIAGVGTLVLNGNGDYTFTPAADWNGTVPAVTYAISDGDGGADTAVLNITVTPVNDAASISGDDAGAVTEAGGVANAAAGSPATGGRLIAADVDAGENKFQATDPADLNGTYGTFTFDPLTGAWSYLLDNGRPATQGLNAGATVTDTLTVTSEDGTATQTITVTITGTNDAPIVTSNAAAAQGGVVEAGIDAGGGAIGNPTATGTLTADDVDAEDTPASLAWSLSGGGNSATGAYGDLMLSSAGVWTYTLDDARADGLKAGETRTETFAAIVTDARGATAQQVITITITGSNDAPTVSGAAAGDVAEDGVQTAIGQLSKTDPDIGDTHAWTAADAGSGPGVGTYGTLTVDATGKWTYVLDNAKAQAIPKDQTVQDTIMVRVTDAAGATAEQLVTITITGENDFPTILGSSTLGGAVTELPDGDPDENSHTHSVTGKIDFSDVDTLVSADTHTVQSITPRGAGYLGNLVLGTVDDAAGTVGWTFEVEDSAIDHLALGDVLTQSYDVVISDGHGGTAVTTVTVTITGANDNPVIDGAASDLSVTVTEIADGAADENTHVHGHQGYVEFSDVDTRDAVHTVSFVPQGGGAGYLGDFTLSPVDNVNDRVRWQFTVPDGLLDTLPQGKTIVQKYDVTISDGHGGTATETVTVTLTGTNDQPVAEDDLTLGTVGSPIVQDVLANDDDIDDGDKARWKVTQVDGQDISDGDTITILDGSGGTVGTVGLNGAGELTFTPGPAFTGSITLPYTVDDGSGAANATATANWIINVAGVDIVDDTSPGTPGTGDNVLASIDDLQHVVITGHAPVGGSIAGLKVTDGNGHDVSIDPATIILNPDGSFSTTADLRTLEDGTLTVTLDVVDSGGHTASVTDTILKDTVTTVAIDPLLVVDGEVPVIRGTGEPGSKVTLKINGVDVPGTDITVDGDGKWTYTPPAALATGEITIAAAAADPYGNTNNATREVASLDIQDKEPGDTNAHILVHEASLAGGSDASADTESADATFTIGTSEGGITQLVIGSTIVDGALSGGTAVTVSQLENLGTTPIPAIPTAYGTLTITGYDAGTGKVSYTYTLSGSTQDHGASGTDTVYEGIQIAVVDHNGDTRVGTLKAGVVDDVPEAKDQAAVALDEGGVTVGWDGSAWTGGTANLITGDPANGIAADVQGADGARVHQVTYNKAGGGTDTVTIPDGGSETVTTAYGSLTVHSDGTWSYTSNGTIAHGSAANVGDNFTYTLIDGDGDISSPATQPITVDDTVPTLGTPDDRSVAEDDLPSGSDGTKEPLAVTGTLAVDKGADPIDTKLTTSSAPAGLTSGGVAVQYELSADGHTLIAYKGAGRTNADKVFTVEVTDPDGADGTPGYRYTLQGPLDHPAGNDPLELTFGFTAKETEAADGDQVTGTFKVTVADDVPAAVDEAAVSVAEGAGRIGYDGVGAWSAGTANLLANDTQGADGAKITQVKYTDGGGAEQTATVDPATGTGELTTQYGKLQVLADGTWWYVPNPAIAHAGGAPVTDPFSYQLTDGDGDVSAHWAVQPISITDTAPVAADDGQATHAEGSVSFGGNVIANDTASKDGGTLLHSIKYKDASGTEQTLSFTDDTDQTVQTLTGELTINRAGVWTFTPALSYDHDAPGADRDGGGFTYRLVDADGSLSNSATQAIRITDTSPTAGPVVLAIDEKNIKTIGSEGAAGDNESTVNLSITRSADAISDVVFNAATITGLSGQALKSGGVALAYVVSGDGHTLTATAGSGGPTVFTLQLNNPTDVDGTTQSVTMILERPLDHADANGTNDLSISVGYQVQDIDSSVNGTLTLTVTDDVPATPQADPHVPVSEGGTAIGSANGGANLLANDTLGADGGRVHDISYTDRDGAAVTNHAVPDGGSTTVQTQYGSLTVHSDGTWSYTPVESADHEKPAKDMSVTDNFTYRVIDGDGDISSSATQPITVIDTTPEIGDPVDGSVTEANLPLGSSPNAGGAPVQASGTLDVQPGKDSFGVAFDPALAGAHATLKSGGEALFYVLTDGGRTLTAHKGDASGAAVFTVVITNPAAGNAGYLFTLHEVLDHGAAATLDLDFGVVMTDSDGDTATDQFTITVADDKASATAAYTLDEDSTTTFNTSADANPDNTKIYQGGSEVTDVTTHPDGSKDYKTDNGTVTVNANGTITYTPDPDYSGTEVFTYQTDDDGNIESTEVTMTIDPVSDAPDLSVAAAAINTLEDTAVSLGLKAPTITDGTDQNDAAPGDAPERLGAITLEGFPKGAVLLAADGVTVLHTFDGVGATQSITIVLTDGPTVAGTTGDLSMTRAEFEALKVLPPENSHANFTVGMTVSSHEVDGAGNIATVGGTPVPGAESTTTVDVYVQAVTDNAALVFNTGATTGIAGTEGTIAYGGAGGNTEATVTLREEGSFDVRDILSASFGDLDGTELRSITIKNDTGTTILVNGTELADGASRTIDAKAGAAGQTGGIDSFPAVRIGGVGDYSGDLDGVKITINAQDKDGDGYWNAGAPVPGTVDGVAEANVADNTVTLNLRVLPGAGDVTAADVDTSEDGAVAFLAGVAVTDADSHGSEVIDAIAFEIPAGWVVTPPAGGDLMADGWAVSGAGTTADPYTISFNADPGGTVLSEAAREAVLDGFMILPPPHSSADATISLSITSTDTNTVGGAPVSDTKTVPHDVKITVTPVAEEIGAIPGAGDSDGDTLPDLAMNGNKDYATPGKEDQWFELNSDGFDMKTPWSNQDASEVTYARLTPNLIDGDGSQNDPNGAKFRWSEDGGSTWQEATYGGDPVDVPVEYLGTLQFMAPPNFSGMFEIKVEAYTVDVDEDGGTTSTAVSGSAKLTNVLIMPVADEVTLTLNGRASGHEDQEIPLSIRPKSSDTSETFNVTISQIPPGATITYGTGAGQIVFTATADDTSLTISQFDSTQPMTIRPPANSNVDFDLKVSAASVDELRLPDPGNPDDYITHTSTKDGPELTISVSVKGVADVAPVAPTPQTYAEAELDGSSPARTVALNEVVSITPVDADGSEALTVRVTGLADGFSPSVGTLLTAPEITGAARVWLLTMAQFEAATIRVPQNYSGEVTFQVAAVTTENDGNSLTGGWTGVGFSVTPSPEATVSTGATVTEDVLGKLDLRIVHQNGDNDEVLGDVRIKVDDASGPGFTLYLGDDPAAAKTLAQAVADGSIAQVSDGGVDYYLIPAALVPELAALGGPNLDEALGGGFDFQYRITDSGYGAAPAPVPVTSDWRDAHFTIEATPVTDVPNVSITAITGTLESTTAADDVASDDAVPDTATLGAADKVTVDLNVSSPDWDGSEHVVRIVIDGVPLGVTVTGAEYLGSNAGGGRWLLVYEGTNAKPIDAAGGISLPVEFVVSKQAGGLTNEAITLSVQVQDRGDESDAGTDVERDAVTWYLNTTFAPAEDQAAARILQWEYNNEHATEDTSFRLSDKITAQVDVQSTNINTFTITIEGLPTGTIVSGMVHTTIIEGGETRDVWTASIDSLPEMSKAQIEARLAELMDRITIVPPPNSNENNAAGTFTFEAMLTTAVLGGETHAMDNIASIAPTVPVDPVTDTAVFSIAVDTAVETGELNESDSSIPLTLTVGNAADGAAGSIVDGTLYLRISSAETALKDGTLVLSGTPDTTLTLQHVDDVPGLPAGDYYVITGVAMGDPLALVYTPGTMTAGTVTVDAWVRNQEANATNGDGGDGIIVSSGSTPIVVHISNDGVDIASNPVSGGEAASSSKSSLIALDLAVALNDGDGSEKIDSILLGNLPDGFLVYVGADAASATLASNAGGSGGLNTWVLSGDGQMPAYVGILPPQHWSGTLDDLRLIVESGETALGESRVDEATIASVTITPVADGLVITPTTTFGRENGVISLNLNSAVQDTVDASIKKAGGEVVAQDESLETTTLKITGLGEHASFYLGGVEITPLDHPGIAIAYSGGAYILSGLNQDDLDRLGFKQAKSALVDQDGDSGNGLQIGIEAWTVESGAPGDESAHVTSTITVSVSDQLATTGNDTLLWTGGSINARSGTDTVQLRSGEDLGGADLAAKLSNVEIIDMGVYGANTIADLTPEQVKAIIGAGGTLTIKGSADDALTLDGGWTDSGGGSYTGTFDSGGTPVTVTLNVTGGVGVTMPPEGGGGFGGGGGGEPLGFAAFMAGFDGMEGADDDYLFGGGELPDLEGVLDPSGAGAQDLGDWLPGAGADDGGSSMGAGAPDTSAGATPSTDGGGAESYAYVPDPLADDELEHALHDGHLVG